ncbi:MAG: T9SS type A sorting domain-containing protein [Candidatus Zixiibacteriota bacterium]
MNHRCGFVARIILLSWCLAFANGSLAQSFEARQPLPIPPHLPFYSAFSKGNPNFCLIQYDHDSVAYYWDGFGTGDGIAVYMDPAICGFDSTYPFKLTNVHFYLHGPLGFTWPVDINVNIRQVPAPEDSIKSPGTLLFSKSYTIPSDSGYLVSNPRPPINLTLDTVVCVESPFFLEITYSGTLDSGYASLVMSDSTDRPDSNQVWLVLKQKYARWDTAWVRQMMPGRPIVRITGYPQAIDCDKCWYFKPKTTKAPSGLPDFDQYQFGSDSVALDGATALSNCLVWLNAIPSIPDPDSLIRLVSSYLHTNPAAGGGTLIDSLKTGLDSLFSGRGLSLYDTIFQNPSFSLVKDSLEGSANVVLLIGLWQDIDQVWYRIGGHYVSVAGVCNRDGWIAASDPGADNAEAGAKGRILPPHDSHPNNHTLHNSKGFVSQDAYVSDTLSVGPYTSLWMLKDLNGRKLPWAQFEGQNFQPEQLPYAHTYDSTQTLYAVVEYAVMILHKPTFVEEEETVKTPRGFELFASYPNPFNNETVIKYSLSKPAEASLAIYNVLGQKVRTLVKNEKQNGLVTVTWDGKDERGRDLSSGVYFYQLRAGQFSQTRRMVLLK